MIETDKKQDQLIRKKHSRRDNLRLQTKYTINLYFESLWILPHIKQVNNLHTYSVSVYYHATYKTQPVIFKTNIQTISIYIQSVWVTMITHTHTQQASDTEKHTNNKSVIDNTRNTQAVMRWCKYVYCWSELATWPYLHYLTSHDLTCPGIHTLVSWFPRTEVWSVSQSISQ